MKKLYQTNKDFKDYVDRYMRNRDVTLEEVLSYKQTQLVGEMYKEQEEEMHQKGIPDWYIESCNTVKYLFPRAHALSYVLLAYRVAYFKAQRPLEFYCAYFTMNADRFDADLLINNSNELKEKIMEYKESDESSKRDMRYVMEACQEMYDAGYRFVSDKIKNEKFDSFFIEDGKIRPKLK